MKEIFGYVKRNAKTVAAIIAICSVPAFYVGGIIVQYIYKITSTGYTIGFGAAKNIGYGILSPVSYVLTTILCLLATVMLASRENKRIGGIEIASRKYSDRDYYGSAHPMTYGELRDCYEISSSPEDLHGIAVGVTEDGKFLAVNTPDNNGMLCCLCPSGGGKTYSVISAIVDYIIRTGGSVIFSDPKGELYKLYAWIFERLGYTIRLINYKDFQCSDGCNFFSIMDYPIGDMAQAVLKMASYIVENTKSETNFFTDVTEGLMTGAIGRVMTGSDVVDALHQRSLATVYEIMNLDMTQIDYILRQDISLNPAKDSVNTYLTAAKTFKDSAIQGCRTMLRTLMSEDLKSLLSENDVDFGLPGKEKCAYFVVMPDTGHESDWLVGLFMNCILRVLTEGIADRSADSKLPVPVHFVLEEFCNIGTITDFSRMLNTGRSRRISFYPIIQDLHLLYDRYGVDIGNNILSACYTKIYLGGDDVDELTQKAFSDLSGDATYERIEDGPNGIKTVYFGGKVYTPHEVGLIGRRNFDDKKRNDRLVHIRARNMLHCRNVLLGDFNSVKGGKYMYAHEHVPIYRSR